MELIGQYPKVIASALNHYENADSVDGQHKALLDLGETVLMYLVGFMFGEYKQDGKINMKLETEFYKFGAAKPSFGIFLSFMRLMSKELPESKFKNKILAKDFEDIPQFILKYELIKQVIDDGADNNFKQLVEEKEKGKNVGKKDLIQFYDSFIAIRNTYAHPEDKAGRADNKRKWPLNEEYFEFINEYLSSSIVELLSHIEEILIQFPPILTLSVNEMENRGEFMLETNSDDQKIHLDFSNEELKEVKTNNRYIVDSNNKLLLKFYYNVIPQLNVEVAREIINSVKAKQMEPHLEEVITEKLSDDGVIDSLEYLILKDNAKSSHISIERLFQLIEKVCKKLNIEKSIGSPENLGDVFVDKINDETKLLFNPHWLNYFWMISKFDRNNEKEEKEKVKEYDKKINKLKDDKKNTEKTLEKTETTIRDKKKQKIKKLKTINDQIRTRRDQIKKTSNLEKKEQLKETLKQLQENLEETKLKFNQDLDELQQKINEKETEVYEKLSDINAKIEKLVLDKEKYYASTQWGIHRNIWRDINQYVSILLKNNLKAISIDDDLEDNLVDEDNVNKWINDPNNWQMGNLSHYYWGRIYPNNYPLGKIFNIAFKVQKYFKGYAKNIHESLNISLDTPCVFMHSESFHQLVAIIDTKNRLTDKKSEIETQLLLDYAKELTDLGAILLCEYMEISDSNEMDNKIILPIADYLANKQHYIIKSIFSRIWTIDMFFKDGAVNASALGQFEKEISIIIQIFSNVIAQINDYAYEIGIDKDYVKDILDNKNNTMEEVN